METQRHILVIDDDADMLRIIRGYLADSYKVTLISSGQEALEFLNTSKPDAIFLDYLMPGMTGVEVLEAIKSNVETKSIPVFFLTAMADTTQIQNIMKIAQGYVQKPISKKEILAVLTNYFDII